LPWPVPLPATRRALLTACMPLIASLSQPWLFNLIDNVVLQQRRIKILFLMALSIQPFSKRCDQK
jgi:hypothetical protein